eukprot:m.166896 g.166896  ORF g.166896 m.166896 type:complete len:406 (-) comp21120_c1_seq2:651-1868(-)
MDITQAFQGSSPSQRLGILRSIFDQLLPNELQFCNRLLLSRLGPEFMSLAQYEAPANNPALLQSLPRQYGPVEATHLLSAYLPHTYHNNADAAAVMFYILQSLPWHSQDSGMFCHTCDYAFSLAINHPAFSPKQSAVLRALLATLNSQQSVHASPPASLLPEGSVVAAVIAGVAKDPKRKEYMYVVDVTWANGAHQRISRSYQDFFDFQCSLLDSFNEQPRIIPFLPGETHTRLPPPPCTSVRAADYNFNLHRKKASDENEQGRACTVPRGAAEHISSRFDQAARPRVTVRVVCGVFHVVPRVRRAEAGLQRAVLAYPHLYPARRNHHGCCATPRNHTARTRPAFPAGTSALCVPHQHGQCARGIICTVFTLLSQRSRRSNAGCGQCCRPPALVVVRFAGPRRQW